MDVCNVLFQTFSLEKNNSGRIRCRQDWKSFFIYESCFQNATRVNTIIENVKIMNSLQEAFCVLIVEIPRGEDQENVSYQTLRRNVKKT